LDAKFVINLDTGEFTHTGATQTGSDQFSYTVADGDGDSASSTLTITVTGPVAPTAVADHIITNILSSQITIDSDVLLANDERGTGAQPLGDVTVNTGWLGGDFKATQLQTKTYADTENTNSNSYLPGINRTEFYKNPSSNANTAEILLKGYLRKASGSNIRDEDWITVTLKAGEQLTLDHNRTDSQIQMYWHFGATNAASGILIKDGGSFVADHDGVYQIYLKNPTDDSRTYDLTMRVDYSGVPVTNPADAHDSYTINGSAGSDSADITVSYQAGNTLQGTDGHEVLLAGSGNDTLNGGKGNDILIGGKGNDTLIGGDGDDIFRWESGDQGSTSQPAKDVVTDFGNGHDKLDLSDLLVGEGAVGADLSKYLQLTEVNGDTVININTKGQLGAVDAHGAATNVDQQIVLENVHLNDLAGGGNQNDMINSLIQQGKLNVDQ
ncbi:MAG TPA: type I secretion C-terminal target domain-containing protein, partial [Candidimonas sp.]|nr:type I secretion C-terminal target domain-containing protein [Candidimonas sp.]